MLLRVAVDSLPVHGVVQQGAAPRQHQVAAQATHSVLERPPLAPTAGAAKVAPALVNKAPPQALTCIGTSQGNGQTAGAPSTYGTQSKVHHSRVFVLCCAVDAPARAAVLNMVQFNGLHGCPRCLTVATHKDGGMRYIVPPAEARTHSQVVRDMHIAQATQSTVNGIKGPSALMSLDGFNLGKEISAEYMHCVLLGVTRQITEVFFSTTSCSERVYVGNPSSVREVNSRLLSIQSPHCITRLPRRIDDRVHWKASEWKHWLLFYALPCLDDLTPQEYWRHLAKLSEAAHIFLTEEISARQIDYTGKVLSSFVVRAHTTRTQAGCTLLPPRPGRAIYPHHYQWMLTVVSTNTHSE
ncbi:uncharacterized protein LOC119180150 [Rhipicephalus microplus]|uniref:uncharacterized protein LOC119180150 n=1 Tax=Rhipicephalus microplus TaxID=6941 RepID=UPI003F6B9486